MYGHQRSSLSHLDSFMLAACVSLAHAETLYVDPQGDDSSLRDGSSTQPWRTLAYAVCRTAPDQGPSYISECGDVHRARPHSGRHEFVLQ